jgi:hypothetical protein
MDPAAWLIDACCLHSSDNTCFIATSIILL